MANPTISQIAINGTTYDACDSQARADIKTLQDSVNNKVSKSGDTMTGYLTIKTSSMNRDAANPASTQWSNALVLSDADNERLAIMETSRMTTGAQQTYLRSYTDNTSGAQVENYIRLDANRDGTKTYSVSDPAAFRSAISAQAALSVQTITGFTVESGYTQERAIMYKYGRIATLTIGVKNNNALNAYTNYIVGTVPSSIRPNGMDVDGAGYNPALSS